MKTKPKRLFQFLFDSSEEGLKAISVSEYTAESKTTRKNISEIFVQFSEPEHFINRFVIVVS